MKYTRIDEHETTKKKKKKKKKNWNNAIVFYISKNLCFDKSKKQKQKNDEDFEIC